MVQLRFGKLQSGILKKNFQSELRSKPKGIITAQVIVKIRYIAAWELSDVALFCYVLSKY